MKDVANSINQAIFFKKHGLVGRISAKSLELALSPAQEIDPFHIQRMAGS